MKKNNSKYLISLATLLVIPSLIGCNKKPAPVVEKINASRVYTTSNASAFAKGTSRTISAITYPVNSYKNLKFVSSDVSILTPNSNGVIYGNDLGTATITVYNDNNDNNAMDSDEPFTYVSYTVGEPDTSRSISLPEEERDINLYVDDVLEIHPIKDGTFQYLSIYSNNSDVCEAYNAKDKSNVDHYKLRGVAPGEVKISLYSELTNYEFTVNVRNRTDELARIRAYKIEPVQSVYNLEVGESKEISFNLYPNNTFDTVATVEVNNEDVCFANSTMIRGKKAGSAIVTVTTTNGKACRFRVVVTNKEDKYEGAYYDDYYGDLSWTDGKDLKAKLHNIIKVKTGLKYDGNWLSNKDSNKKLTDYSKVDAVYTSDDLDINATSSAWNREHVFPATMMTALNTGATNIIGRATDFHNLFAAEKDNNSSRNNSNLGYVDRNSIKYIDRGECAKLSSEIFEPADIDKGRLARSIFYMGVMYDEYTPATFSDSGTTFTVNQRPLEIVEDVVGYNRFKFSDFQNPGTPEKINYVNQFVNLVKAENPEVTDETELLKLAFTKYLEDCSPYSIGNLSTLLGWNSFAVDLEEVQHNESVYSFDSGTYGGVQGNRNPFVDYPQLVEYVYGSLQDKAGSLKDLKPTYEALEMDAEGVHHYAFNGETPTFMVSESVDVSLMNVVAIKADLKETDLDLSKLSVDPYTFTEADIPNGKDILVRTDKNNLRIHVNVTEYDPTPKPDGHLKFADCSYQTDEMFNKSTYNFPKGSDTTTILQTGIQWIVKTGVADPVIGTDNAKGVKFGTSAKPVDTLKFESVNSLNNINGVFFKVGTASKKTYHWVIKCGEQIIGKGDTTTSDTIEYGVSFATLKFSGFLSFEFSGLDAHINVLSWAFNVAEE